MATSSWVSTEDLESTRPLIEERGYKTFIHPQSTDRLHQSAGTAEEKTDALHDLFENPDIKAIIGARGGNRAITMLNRIDFAKIIKNPKIFCGYSDLTVLLNAIHAKTGLITFHGPVFREFSGLPDPDMNRVLNMFSGAVDYIPLPGATWLKALESKAEGPLIGGNLSLFQTLIGTPYEPDLHRAILFLEDTGDHISRYDRILAHLRISGRMDNLSAIIFGSFTNTQEDPDRPFGFTLEDCIREHTQEMDIPVLINAPFGHNGPLPVFPVGCRVRLEKEGLKLLERPVRPVA